MSQLVLISGLLLLAIVVTDLLWTTLWIEGGAGPLTSIFMALAWRTIRPFKAVDSRILTFAGPIILTLGLVMWIVMLWGGWALIFASSESAITDTVNKDPISWSDSIYFAGYAVFTLGNGDFSPNEGLWQFITTLATASGMLLITLSVTYIVNVLSAVTQKRSFASGISGLGEQGTDVLRASWNGNDFEGLELPLNTFTTQLNTLTSNHKAYPILHYFHSKQRNQSPIVRVAILDEALTLLRFGISEQSRPSNAIIQNARSSVESYLKMLQSAFIEPADRTPPPPNIERLREEELPTVSNEEFTTALEELDDRRKTLLGLIDSDAREWPSKDEE